MWCLYFYALPFLSEPLFLSVDILIILVLLKIFLLESKSLMYN